MVSGKDGLHTVSSRRNCPTEFWRILMIEKSFTNSKIVVTLKKGLESVQKIIVSEYKTYLGPSEHWISNVYYQDDFGL